MASVHTLRAGTSALNITNHRRPQLLGVEDAASFLGLSVWTLRSWAYSGRIASHKISTRLMFHVDDLEKIIAASRRPALERNTTGGEGVA